MKLTFKFISIILIFPLYLSAQVFEVNPPDYIKTISFRGNSQESQLPILNLGDPLVLEFDALNGEEADFYYIIEHFNFDWTPSQLVKMEYLSGFDNQRIRDYENSLNTYQIFSHYTLRIPNQQTRGLLKSGNYVLSIYNDDQELMFNRKFMVVEELVAVGVDIKRSRDVKFIDEKQSVDIIINTSNINLNNPQNTVKTLLIQNNNLNTAINDLKPQYTLGNELVYRYVHESSFWGGNEYFFFENKDVRASNVSVQFTDLRDLYHSFLFVNGPRADRPYTYNPDINGNFLINALDADDMRIEADYTVVHFGLQYPELTNGGNIYVYGNFNNFGLQPMNKMIFNSTEGIYEAEFKLKQGFYNYKYVVVDNNGKLNEGRIGGDFWQTENNYKVLVYYRDLGARYDRLIGFGEANSINISN